MYQLILLDLKKARNIAVYSFPFTWLITNKSDAKGLGVILGVLLSAWTLKYWGKTSTRLPVQLYKDQAFSTGYWFGLYSVRHSIGYFVVGCVGFSPLLNVSRRRSAPIHFQWGNVEQSAVDCGKVSGKNPASGALELDANCTWLPLPLPNSVRSRCLLENLPSMKHSSTGH